MLYLKKGKIPGTFSTATNQHPKQWMENGVEAWISVRDAKNWVEAELFAGMVNLLLPNTGDGGVVRTCSDYFIATDKGEYTTPRYDVIARPMVGDLVSKSFNGDTYPCGTITKISPTMKKITTSDGTTFYRPHDRAGHWLNHGTFSMVPGHRYEQNPSF